METQTFNTFSALMAHVIESAPDYPKMFRCECDCPANSDALHTYEELEIGHEECTDTVCIECLAHEIVSEWHWAFIYEYTNVNNHHGPFVLDDSVLEHEAAQVHFYDIDFIDEAYDIAERAAKRS